MSEASTIPAKYVFLDVVSFTQGRSVEAQSDIVHAVNGIVEASIVEHEVDKEHLILLPTGDGICVALLNIETPYDIHLRMALSIIKGIQEHNAITEDKMRRFQVRIGLNANTDNLVIDVNGNQNIAGAGINIASRVMNLADGNQILVGQSVYDTLRYREKYMHLFDEYVATVKHGVKLPIYQFIQMGHSGLNTDVPTMFQIPEKSNPKLSKTAAYFVAHAMKNRSFILEHLAGNRSEYGTTILLWFLAQDSERSSEATEIETPVLMTYKAREASFEEQLKYYDSIHIFAASSFADLIYNTYLSKYQGCFEQTFNRKCQFVSSAGAEQLKCEWPSIWAEFNFEACPNQGKDHSHSQENELPKE